MKSRTSAYYNVTLTLPKELVDKIDRDRGDVNRSRYVTRLIEKAYKK